MSVLEVELDEQDERIRAHRASKLEEIVGPVDGDFVEFADGVTLRVSHVSDDRVQTSDDGDWYLGDGRVGFSGGLRPGVERSTIAPTGRVRDGRVWFFHHDQHKAHNGVETTILFNVWRCSLEAPW